MTTTFSREASGLLARHVEVLKTYAHRALLRGDLLTPAEETDRAYRMFEFTAMGSALKLTEREMVTLIYRDMFKVKRHCDCRTCQYRRGGQQ